MARVALSDWSVGQETAERSARRARETRMRRGPKISRSRTVTPKPPMLEAACRWLAQGKYAKRRAEQEAEHREASNREERKEDEVRK